MNEQDVRALVREAIERHLGRPEKRGRESFSPEPRENDSRPLFSDYPSPLAPHPSHLLLTVLPGSEADDGTCVIEPAVRCNHCGFCQSLGH